jgi:ribosomal protein S18 acetylase RimI-like enzyme
VSGADFRIEERSYEDPDVARMVAEVQAQYVLLYGGPDVDHTEPSEFAAPAGAFLVGVLDGVAVAMGGWRRLDEKRAEIKRMYVVAAARRRGLARLMLDELERTAAAAGVRELVLSTGPNQPEAVALYERAGYLPAPPFGHYAGYRTALFYAKPL